MREKLKLYYLCRFTQLSPLRLSGGKNDRTDNDLMLDSRGLPMIPGSALAGVLRSRLPREDADLLFGKNTVGNDMTESAVLVGDAALPAGAKVRFTHRDGVGLDERKIAIPKAKYDFETAECSVPYTAVIEWSGWSDAPALPPAGRGRRRRTCLWRAHDPRVRPHGGGCLQKGVSLPS